MPYSALQLTDESRAEVLKRYPPVFRNVLATHITVHFPSNIMPQWPKHILVTGHVVADGVEALVVQVDGRYRRSDGRSYHLTLSLADGHKPVEANKAIASRACRVVTEDGFLLDAVPVIVKTS